MIVLDTTVLVYAKGLDHPLRDPCRALIERIGRGVIRATTTVEVLQEFMHVRARRANRNDAARLALEYADLLAPLTVVGDGHLRVGARLFAANLSLGAFDAVLCAVALELGAPLVSADAAFSDVTGLAYRDPASALQLTG